MMGKPDEVQKLALKDVMAGSHAQAARKSAVESCVHGASKHVYMDKHTMYTVQPHANSALHTDSYASMWSSSPDTVQRWHTTNTRWLYGDNHINKPNGSLIFAAARRPDWSNAAGRQPYLSFSGSKEQIAVQKVNNYQTTHAHANENAMACCGSTALICDVQTTCLQNHPRGPKVLPFLAPVLQHQHTSEFRAQKTPTGQAVILPLWPATAISSSRIMPLDSSVKPNSTQLTIFYAGRINVYNDVSPTQAQNIILKAAALDRFQTDEGSKLDGPTAAAGCQLLQPKRGNLDAEKSVPSVMSNEAVPLAHAAIPDLLQLDLSIGQSGQSARDPIDIDHSPARAQEVPPTAGAHQCAFHGDEPAVPKALPHARKASLVRFLEKRRERMLSKAPYLVEKSFLT